MLANRLIPSALRTLWDVVRLTQGGVVFFRACRELQEKWTLRGTVPFGFVGFFHMPDYPTWLRQVICYSGGGVATMESARYQNEIAFLGKKSQEKDMPPHYGPQRLIYIPKAAVTQTPSLMLGSNQRPLFPANTSKTAHKIRERRGSINPYLPMTTSAPRPSVKVFTLSSRPSRSVWKFHGSAPKDFAKSRRDRTESTARTFLGS